MRARHGSYVWAMAMVMTAAASFYLKPTLDPAVQVRAAVPLEQLFPTEFGAWTLDTSAVAPVRPAFDVAKRFQMYDQVLERTYVNALGDRMMLSVAYGRQQSVGLQMHRPEVCYKAGGFQVELVQDAVIPILDSSLPVTRLLAHMEGRPEPITYWRLIGEDVVTDDSNFRLQTWSLHGAALMDGLLVRVSSIESDTGSAWTRQAGFIDELARAMSTNQRARVLGRSR